MGSYVYKFLDNHDNIIYIGKTTNLSGRLTYSHFTNHGHLPEVCYEETNKIFYSKLNNDDEMSIYERYLINKCNPKFNTYHNNQSQFRFELPDLKWIEFVNKKTGNHVPFDKKAKRLKLYLDTFIDKKLFKKEQNELKQFITSDFDSMISKLQGRHKREPGLKILNKLIVMCDIPYIIKSCKESKRVEGKVKSVNYWIVENKGMDCLNNFLTEVSGKDLYDNEQQELSDIIINNRLANVDYRTKRIKPKTLSTIIKKLELPFKISQSRQTTKGDNKGKRYIVVTRVN